MKRLLLMLCLSMVTLGALMAQRTVSGTITSDDGEPLIGANVIAKGTTVGTITDFDGSYTLDVPEGVETLVVSYTGFENQEIELGAQSVVDLVMQEGVYLDEFVVAALGVERDEKSLGYAVTELQGDEIADSKEGNVVNALAGRVAGVQIQGAPSSLGGASRITIRGSNSFLGNNQPLFVVDGIPIDNSQFATNGSQRGFGTTPDGDRDRAPYDYGNTAQDIDPESIESMSVLKGAAATALYGQRGANGVIIITTKNGSGQKGLGVEYNTAFTMDRVANLIPHQREYGGGAINSATSHGFYEVVDNGQTYLTPLYQKDGAWGPKYDASVQYRPWYSWDANDASTYRQTIPWVAPASDYEDFFETGTSFNNSVALTGGNELGSFRLGYSNLNQKGTFPNAELKKNAISFNSSYDIHSRVNVALTGNYTRTDAENRNATGYNNSNPMQAFTQWWQTQIDIDRLKKYAYATDGSQQSWNPNGLVLDPTSGDLLGFDASPNFFDNPYWVRDNYLQEDSRDRLYGNATVTINLLKGLDLMGRFGTDFYQFNAREGIPIASVAANYYGETQRKFNENNYEARLTYNTQISPNLTLNALVGGNRMRKTTRRVSAESQGGLNLEGFYHISNSAQSPLVNTEEFKEGINSLYGSASFGFKNFLYVDVTARNDWSSTLPTSENSYFYPSVSTSIVLTEIAGLDNIDFLSFAKLRAGYAEVGIDADPYELASTYEPASASFGGTAQYGIPNAQPNPQLKPERTSEIEVGLDLRFLRNRISLDVAYYDRTTEDLIFEVPSSATTGFSSRLLNAGEMKNSGLEFQLGVTPVQTKDFSWDIGFNIATVDNEVVSVHPDVESILRGGTWAADLRIAEGQPYMAVFGQDYVRENYEEDADGNIIRNDGRRTVNDNGEYNFTSQRVFLGSAIADYTGGISTQLNYKGISLGALIDFQEGGVIHSTSLQWAKYSGMSPETVSFNGQSDIRANGLILPGIKADGSENDIAIDPQAYYQGTFRVAAPNVYDASFVKLREVRLGYTIPNKVLGKVPFRDVRLSLFGRNLAILSSDLPYLDPQVVTGAGNDQGLENAQIPSTRTFGVNLSLKL